MTVLVKISGLTVDFDQGHRITRALHGINLSVCAGEAIGLVGESGSGKSVTWLAALGLLPGKARVGDRSPWKDRSCWQDAAGCWTPFVAGALR